ncbi:MAG: NAD-glutamate dehydrogenase, partial [Rhodospirillales bacterium]|nr:NAD-glutamate dehydrogenase [Rhodospirillales bacterium]
TDDMPFLVDSALGALTRLDLPMQTLVHPVLPVRRDAAGQMQAIEAGGAPESMMQIGFGPEADSAKLAEVAAALKRAMTDVRAAVGDFDAMAARLNEAGAALPEGSAEREFLGWLAAEGNMPPG